MFEAYYSQLNTPCLVVDEPMTRENIKRMQQVADANGCTLRPHIKTHKTPYFAKLQQQLDALNSANTLREVRAKVSAATGVPADLLSGDTEEVCTTQAQAILKFAKPGYPNVRDGGEPRNPPSQPDGVAAAFFKRNPNLKL